MSESTLLPLPDMDATTSRRGLALRYRPRRFDELTGQRHAAAILGRMVERGNIARQLLLSGGSGLGKTTVGRIYAATLLCTTEMDQRPGGDACGRCESCRDVTADVPRHLDVIEMDAASNGGKDEIREIAAGAALAPVRGRFKVYIIDEVHAITGAGAQAFLKLLEEPPEHCVFVLCTTNPEKLSSGAGGAGTVRGRCTELELVRPSDAELVANLERIANAEGFALPQHVAHQVIAATDPTLGVRGTVMTLEKLANRLHEPDELDDDELAALLGTVSASRLTALTDALQAGRRRDALEQLAHLRQRSSDAAIRGALVRWARTGLQQAIDGEGDVGPEQAVARLEAVLGAPAGEHWTDVAVVRLARPATDPSQLAAIGRDATEVLAELQAAIAAGRQLARAEATPAPPTAAHAQDARDEPAPSATPVVDAPDFEAPDFASPDFGAATSSPEDDAAPHDPGYDEYAYDEHGYPDSLPPEDFDPAELGAPPPDPSPQPRRDSSRARGRGAAPSTPGRGRTPGSSDRRSPKLRSLINRVATFDAEVARLLQSCDVSFPSGRVRVVPPDTATSRSLRTAESQRLLLDAARHVHCTRVLVEDV